MEDIKKSDSDKKNGYGRRINEHIRKMNLININVSTNINFCIY